MSRLRAVPKVVFKGKRKPPGLHTSRSLVWGRFISLSATWVAWLGN